MAKYLIRLDDACPKMNHKNWDEIERVLSYNDIRPIVGVIPDSRDMKFSWDEDPDFWKKVKKWETMGWTIAMHGCHHELHSYDGSVTYCKTTYSSTEFAGVPYEEQFDLLSKAYDIFVRYGIEPKCFFAPGHTFDSNTVKALKNVGKGEMFISDGCDLFPFTDLGVKFLPTMFDSPINLDYMVGYYTFVFHPSFMTEEGIATLSNFIKKHRKHFISSKDVVFRERKQGVSGKLCEELIYFIRRIRSMH